ncbi:Uma2 family endonuclease [Cyanobacteria bacterium FACHB-DQ100]|uniref:Uma2 family endonuclease n=1 Tax=Leptolyngbya sp. DQ-M1 TaxID=2933920 RepID=UPI0019BCFDE5|nr:Uma2 family endonuclease [Cyanobacteria bacterium FACHB-DQ100]
MSVTIAKWTLEEYHRMIEAGILDDRRVELLRGEIVEMPPEGEPHAFDSNQAFKYLLNLLEGLADVRGAKPITLPNQSEPEPDLAIVQDLGREYREHHPYPENIFWLIEYSNSSPSKDLGIKRKIYAEVGISEYWIVDLKRLQLIVLRDPQDGDYRSETTLTTGTIAPLAFPEISISVDRILNS